MQDSNNTENRIPSDSLNKRYLFKIFSKILTAPLLLFVQALLPRGLGPEMYGKFIFQTNFFQQVVAFFDSGTSLAFFTSLSKNLGDKSIIRFYGGYSIVAAIVIFFVTSLVFLFGLGDSIFPNQEVEYIFLALLFSVVTWWSEVIYKIIDAYGLTIAGEKIFIYQKFISLFILFALYYFGFLTLLNVFIYNFFILTILIVWWTRCLYLQGIYIFNIPPISSEEVKVKSVYFWNYSSPLLFYSFSGVIIALFDNWLLMKIAGPIQQAFFGLAFKLSAISFMFTGAMTQLITREFSIAHGNNDKVQLATLFRRYIPLLYFISSIFSVFFITNAEVFTNIFGGDEFRNGTIPVAIMLLYPIHQTYGQLSGSLFYSTGQTKLYRNIGISMMPLGLVFTWLALSPNHLGGFELGALGLAIKTVFLQFIAVNVQLYFNSKYLKLSFLKYLIHQFFTLIILFSIAFLSKWAISLLINSLVLSAFLSGVMYLIFILLVIYIFPQVISMMKQQRDEYILRGLQIIKSKIG
jgi:O-antigen/teichoic acid export membrane protein